jgi:hypothetical protein
MGQYEGAMGSTDSFNGSVGVTFVHDDTREDADGDGDVDSSAYLADFAGSFQNFGFGAEVARFDDDFVATTDEDYSNIFDGMGDTFLTLQPDSLPWAVYASYLINPEWEVGARYEDLDNDDSDLAANADNTVISFVANWYRGTAGKWQLQYTIVDADTDGFDDGNIVEVGYAVGTTR